jgi:hypothetical protein
MALAVALFYLGDKQSLCHAKVMVERLTRWSSAPIGAPQRIAQGDRGS